MKDIAGIFLSAAVVFIFVFNIIKKKRKSRNELKGLTILLYMLVTQKAGDANSVLFALEKYSEANRKLINQLRISYLKNVSFDPDTDKRNNRNAVFYEAAGILFRSGPERTAEYMEGAAELAKNNSSRINKVRNEIVNSVGIIFTMIIMFLIIIYFLSPYIGFFNINNI